MGYRACKGSSFRVDRFKGGTMRRWKLFMPLLGLVFAGALLCGCNGLLSRPEAGEQGKNTEKRGSLFLEQTPVEPLKWPYVSVYDEATNKFVTLYWASLKPEQKKRDLLPLNLDHISVFSESSGGSLSIAPITFSAKNSTYLLVFDFIKGDVEQVCNKDRKPITTATVGIGVRVKARITTREAGFGINSIGDLAAAAKAEKIQGQLYVQSIGVDSQSISDLMPFTADISQNSVQVIMQSLAAIKAKMWDDKTRLTPYLVSVAAPEGLSWSDLYFCGDAPASTAGMEKISGIRAPTTLMLGPLNLIQ